ncbi:MAG: divalent-cation tolerance protein CutA [Desulfobacterales bacterium]|nr:divalent-cation tolerance protein CutA [Desulfobacterales bacterium]
MQLNLIYITVGSKDEARKIGKILVTSGLAACVNIIDNINSMYIWEGAFQDDQEVLLIAKTQEARVPELIETVKTLHSYSCPCIVSLPISDGNRPFLDWICQQTA